MSERLVEFDFSAASRGVIKIDGAPVSGVRAARIEVRLGSPTVVTLELVGKSVKGIGVQAEKVYVETTECSSASREYLPA